MEPTNLAEETRWQQIWMLSATGSTPVNIRKKFDNDGHSIPTYNEIRDAITYISEQTANALVNSKADRDMYISTMVLQQSYAWKEIHRLEGEQSLGGIKTETVTYDADGTVLSRRVTRRDASRDLCTALSAVHTIGKSIGTMKGFDLMADARDALGKVTIADEFSYYTEAGDAPQIPRPVAVDRETA